MSWTKEPIHLKVVAGIMLVRGLLMFLAASFIVVIFGFVSEFVFVAFEEEGMPVEIIAMIEGILFLVRIVIFGYAIFNILGGVLLYYGHEAGRIIGIIVNIIAIWNVPVGTALGIYSLLVLFEKR